MQPCATETPECRGSGSPSASLSEEYSKAKTSRRVPSGRDAIQRPAACRRVSFQSEKACRMRVDPVFSRHDSDDTPRDGERPPGQHRPNAGSSCPTTNRSSPHGWPHPQPARLRGARVYSGEAAIEPLDSFQPDMLITDVIMTGINGIETAIAARRKRPNCKVLLFSGQVADADPVWRRRCHEGTHEFDGPSRKRRPPSRPPSPSSAANDHKSARARTSAFLLRPPPPICWRRRATRATSSRPQRPRGSPVRR